MRPGVNRFTRQVMSDIPFQVGDGTIALSWILAHRAQDNGVQIASQGVANLGFARGERGEAGSDGILFTDDPCHFIHLRLERAKLVWSYPG